MSGDAVVVFFGICLDVDLDDIEGLEERSDERILRSRKASLDHYWGNFGEMESDYLLLIGSRIGVFGPEGQNEASLNEADIEAIFTNTRRKLAEAGFAGNPNLIIRRHPDL
jgi:hypothetical protein